MTMQIIRLNILHTIKGVCINIREMADGANTLGDGGWSKTSGRWGMAQNVTEIGDGAKH